MNSNPSVEIILSLARSKNKCLERLHTHTKKIIELNVDQLIQDGQILDQYQEIREDTLHAIDLFDRKMSEHINLLKTEDKSSDFISEIKFEMSRYETILISIFNSDDIVFKKLEHASRQVLRHLHENKKTKENLERIKHSTGNTNIQPDTGTGLDTTL